MGLIDNQQFVQTLFAHRTNLSFGMGIRNGGAKRGLDHLDAFGAKHHVVAMDEKADGRITFLEFPDHLGYSLTDFFATEPQRARPKQLSTLENGESDICNHSHHFVLLQFANSG
jgi:hypothetical protein